VFRRRVFDFSSIESAKNDEPVIYEKEVIIALDPAHEEKPTLVERERIEKELGKERRKSADYARRGSGRSITPRGG
jgi:hypothetical protein